MQSHKICTSISTATMESTNDEQQRQRIFHVFKDTQSTITALRVCMLWFMAFFVSSYLQNTCKPMIWYICARPLPLQTIFYAIRCCRISVSSHFIRFNLSELNRERGERKKRFFFIMWLRFCPQDGSKRFCCVIMVCSSRLLLFFIAEICQ